MSNISDLIPPASCSVSGSIEKSDYLAVASSFWGLRDSAVLSHTIALLDVGCGTGRMALPLMASSEKGSYEGFDIVKEGSTGASPHGCCRSALPLATRRLQRLL